jgi:hypothetical protein
VILFGRDPKSRGCAIVVFQNLRTGKDQSLTRVVSGHFHATRLESTLQFGKNFIVQDELPLENAADDLASDVVFGRT